MKKIWFSPALLAVLTVASVVMPGRSVRAAETGADPDPIEVQEEQSPAVAIAPDKLDTLLYPQEPSADPVPAMAMTVLPGAISPPEVEDRHELSAAAQPNEAPAPAVEPSSELQQDASADLQQLRPVAQVPSTLPADDTPPPEDPRVLVAEVAVSGATGELEQAVYEAVSTRPGQTTSRTQLQQDVNAIFATGFFSRAEAVPSDTPLGVRITFVVQPNPALQAVQIPGSQVVTPEVINEIFGPTYGSVINLNDLQQDVDELMEWYAENGYALARILDIPRIGPNGVVTLQIAEGVIEDIRIQFIDEQGELFDEDGDPIEGRTRDFIITREFETQPGDVFNERQIEQDLRNAFALGIFEDLRLGLDEGNNNQVIVTVNVVEGQTGSVAAGVGVSSASGLFGTLSYQERNVGGNNQRLAAEIQLGERDLLFDISFTDPWIATDPNRTSYTVNAFSRRSIPLVFQGGDEEVFLPNGDRPRVRRLGGGITFGRPFENGWSISAGLRYQNIRLQDSDGDLAPEDELGNDLSFSGDGTDDLVTLQVSASLDDRDSALTPTRGSALRLSTEQSIPIGQGSIFMNRLRASYSYFIPVDFTDFSEEGGETLAFNIQGGVVLGDLPPYEAFSLGGTDSVRGYDSGDVGSGRAFLLGTVEYRFPIFSIVGGALFFDVGTDLGTGSDVPGEPAEIRDKPGSGLGYGFGIRVQSPLGPIRVDYAFNDEGDSRLHFGIGERF